MKWLNLWITIAIWACHESSSLPFLQRSKRRIEVAGFWENDRNDQWMILNDANNAPTIDSFYRILFDTQIFTIDVADSISLFYWCLLDLTIDGQSEMTIKINTFKSTTKTILQSDEYAYARIWHVLMIAKSSFISSAFSMVFALTNSSLIKTFMIFNYSKWLAMAKQWFVLFAFKTSHLSTYELYLIRHQHEYF